MHAYPNNFSLLFLPSFPSKSPQTHAYIGPRIQGEEKQHREQPVRPSFILSLRLSHSRFSREHRKPSQKIPPLTSHHLTMTNHHWQFHPQSLRQLGRSWCGISSCNEIYLQTWGYAPGWRTSCPIWLVARCSRCLAPHPKVINGRFDIAEGLITTVHSITWNFWWFISQGL